MMNIKLCGKINTTRLILNVADFFTFDYDKDGNVTEQVKKFMSETILPAFKADLGPDFGSHSTAWVNGQMDQLYEAMTVLNFSMAKGQNSVGVRSIGASRDLYLNEDGLTQLFDTMIQEDHKATQDDTIEDGAGEGTDVKEDPVTPPPGGTTQGGTSTDTVVEDGEVSSTDDVEVIVKDTLAEIGMEMSHVAQESVPMSEILKTVFPGEKKLFFDKTVDYFKDVVSKLWVDTKVENGKVVGFNGLANAATRIKENLENSVSGIYEKSSNQYTEYLHTDGEFKEAVVLYNLDNEVGANNANVLTAYTVTEDNSEIPFINNRYYSNDSNVTIYAGTTEELAEIDDYYKNTLNYSVIKESTNESPVTIDHNTTLSSNGEIEMNNDEIFYANTLLTYYDTFLKEYFPGLSKKYQERHRTGFVKDETVTALDQDSAVTKMHKLTTPRLVMNSSGEYEQDKEHPYLLEQDFMNVMDELTTLPRDIKGFRDGLKSIIEHNTSNYKSVIESIYNRFFNDEQYSFIDSKGNKVDHVSYHTLTTKHASEAMPLADYNLYKGENTQNSKLEDSLSGLITNFTSSAIREKFMSKNGKGTPTNSLTGAVMSDFEDKMAASTSVVLSSGSMHTNPDVFINEKKRFELDFGSVDSNNQYEMTFSKGGQLYKFTVQINLNKKEDGYQDGIPVKIVKQPEGMNEKTLVKLMKDLHIPHNLLGNDFINSFNNKAQLSNKHSGNPNALTEFYLGLIHLMQCNTEKGSEYNKGASRTVEAAEKVPFNYGDNLGGYKEIFSAAMNDTFGPLKSKFIKNLNGDRLAINIVKTKWDDVKRLIRMAKQNPGSINASSAVVNGPVKVLGLYSKAGISLNGVTKANSELTLHESNQLLIEQAYLQMAASTTNYNKGMFQMGTMSDRSDVPLVATEHESTFFPVVDGKYDSTPIMREMYRSHVAHHRGNLRATQEAWANVLQGEGIKPPRPLTNMNAVDLANYIASLNLDFKMVKANYPVVSNISIDKAKVNGRTIAVVPEGTVQNCIIFDREDSPLLHSYMENSKAKFIADLRAMGYYDSKLSDESMALLAKRFPKNTVQQQKEALFDSFFYNSNMVGQSLLQLHTGGYSQFAAKRVAPARFLNSFQYNNTTKSYELNPTAIQDFMGKLKSLSEEDIKNQFGLDSDEMYFKKIVESNKINDADKALIIAFDDISRTNHAKFIDQSKRNAMSGSGVQTPRMVGKQEPGALVGNFSKAITFDDPGEDILLLGAKEKIGQDAYDAVMCGHPLYFIKLNNSLGNSESNFSTKGEPVKDITNEVDAKGHHRGQKKATFDSFANEMLRKGSPELYNLLYRLNTAVDFHPEDQVIYVDELDGNFEPVTNTEDDFSNVVTTEIWQQNGHALGEVMVVQEDGTKLVYNTRAFVNQDIEVIQDLLENGKVLTSKKPKQFKNIQELWEYFGSVESDTAWDHVANVIGNYAGHNCKETMLASMDSNIQYYTLREAYVEKAGFATQEKMGNKNILPASSLTDPTFEFKYTDKVGINRTRYSEIDNTYHGVILSAGHDYDTSSTTKSEVFSDDEHDEHGHDATVSLITQIISANIAQGESLAESRKIYSTLGAMSNSVLDSIRRKISNTILKEVAKTTPNFDAQGFYNDIMDSTNVTRAVIEKSLKTHGVKDPQAVINVGYAEYARDIVRSTLASRETGSIASEIVNQDDVNAVTFDLKQMLPLTQSALNAEFNRKAVRNKFPGMQFVVAPSHDFVHMYNIENVDGSVYRSGVTRDMINKVAYETEDDSRWADIVEHNFPETIVTADNLVNLFGINPNNIKVKDVAQATITDNIYVTNDFLNFEEGEIVPMSTLIRGIKNYLRDTGKDYSNASVSALVDGNVTWRLGKLNNASKSTLKWQSYKRLVKNPDGSTTEQDFIDTPEYKMFKDIMPLTKAFKNLKKLDATLESIEQDLVNPENMRSPEVMGYIEESLDKAQADYDSLLAMVSPEMRNVVTDVVVNKVKWDEAIVRYSAGVRQNGDALQSPEEVIEIISTEQNKNNDFIKIFEAGAQNILSDKDAKWSTNPAEFYLPPMHQTIYLLEEGDSVTDIAGLQEQPDKNKLIQAGILNYDEAWEADMDFNTFDKEFKGSKRYDALDPDQKAAYDNFSRLKSIQLLRMNEFFKTRLDGMIDKAGLFKPRGTRGLNMKKNISNMIQHAKNMLSKSKYGTAEHELWSKVLYGDPNSSVDTIEDLGLYKASKMGKIPNKKVLNSILDTRNHRSPAYAYRTRKLTAVINSFPASLEFITARIPAQGKQSYIAAVTKEFLFSSRNACFGPLDLLTATGAD